MAMLRLGPTCSNLQPECKLLESRRAAHAAASCSYICTPQSRRQRPHRSPDRVFAAAVQEVAPEELAALSSNTGTGLEEHDELLVAPESFQLAPGEVSEINRAAAGTAADVFRCSGCLELACQVCCMSSEILTVLRLCSQSI